MAEVDEARPPSGNIAEWVKGRWKRADNALAEQRRDYWLNLSFVEGDQWVMWHDASRTVFEWPRERDSDRVRLTANRMQPNLVNLLAKLTKRNLTFEVQSNGADDASLGGARLGEHLLETERNDRHWEQVRRDELNACFLGGTSAVMVEWDPNLGEQLYVDPESEESISEGNVVLSALSITEFTLEPGTRYWQDSRWVIACRAMPSAQVRDHYKLAWTPKADVQALSGPMQRRITGGFGSLVDLTNVYTYYERPTNSGKGRWAVVVNEQTVLDKPWPFPFDTLNLYPFRQVPLPKQWTGHTFLNDARSLQVAYNHAISMLQEHMKLAGNARLALPDNSGVEATDLSDLPGEIIPYDGMANAAPHWLEPPNLPRWLQDHTLRLESKLDDVMGVHNISRGVAPGDRNSGLALSVLAEQDESPTGLMAHDQADGWGYIGTLYLKLMQDKVSEYRVATVASDAGVPAQRRWTGKMLNGQTRSTVPLDNVLPHSRAATQAWVTQFGPQFPQLFQGLNSAQLARLLDLPSPAMFAEAADADAAQAQRENMLMADGLIPSLGDKPFPQPFDNHAVHIAEHNRFRKSREYYYAPDKVRNIVDMHIKAHENEALKEAAGQRAMNQTLPGSAAFPQAHEPPGSMVPPDLAEQPPPAPTGGGGPAAPMPTGAPR